MKTTFVSLVFMLTAFISIAQKQEKIKIPSGIVYHYETPSLVEKGRQAIADNIKNTSEYSLCSRMLIIGPNLWRRFGNISELNSIEGGNATFLVDRSRLSGKMTQNIDDTKKVWKALRDEIDGQDISIRKLNEKELEYYWSVISFDIDEPIFILETKEHKYILDLDRDLKLGWLDEAP